MSNWSKYNLPEDLDGFIERLDALIKVFDVGYNDDFVPLRGGMYTKRTDEGIATELKWLRFWLMELKERRLEDEERACGRPLSRGE